MQGSDRGYDDLLISNIELTTDDESDDNYCLMFNRKKKEAFLTLNARAQQELGQVPSYSDSYTTPTPTRPPSSTNT